MEGARKDQKKKTELTYTEEGVVSDAGEKVRWLGENEPAFSPSHLREGEWQSQRR